uniref:Cytochrome P450 n=1 Tax=Dracunculus medinensis TaxID=318479 RepID=A0A0N4UBU9_DRAME
LMAKVLWATFIYKEFRSFQSSSLDHLSCALGFNNPQQPLQKTMSDGMKMTSLSEMRIGNGEKILIASVITGFAILYISYASAAIIISILLIKLISKLNYENNFWRNRGIRGPKPNLFFGSYFQLKNGIKPYDIENTKKYGSVFSYVSFIENNLDFYSMKKATIYTSISLKRAEIPIINNVVGNNKRSLRSKLMFVLRDDIWREIRRSISPTFSTAKLKNVCTI